jgi:putative iron-dependent peroxidase
MTNIQKNILKPVPPLARYLTFKLKPGIQPKSAFQDFLNLVDGTDLVVGLGKSLIQALDSDIPLLKDFPAHKIDGEDMPSTPAALWCWLRGTDRGDLVLLTHQINEKLNPAFDSFHVVDAFHHGSGRDLTGYEDGTENPEGDDALLAAFVQNDTSGMNGSSFAAVQIWNHNLSQFYAMTQQEQDHAIGRRKSDNEELEDAPDSAHVKRTEQESFSPEATLLRRSMPWADAKDAGLYFVAFGKDFSAFEAQLKRMVGEEDGIIDALFQFSKPVTGNYFWCPPIKDGAFDLQAIGL